MSSAGWSFFDLSLGGAYAFRLARADLGVESGDRVLTSTIALAARF